MCLSVAGNRNDVAFYRSTVNSHGNNALVDMSGVLDLYLIYIASELTCSLESVPLGRDRRIDLQSVKVRHDTEDILGDSNHIPGSRTGEP